MPRIIPKPNANDPTEAGSFLPNDPGQPTGSAGPPAPAQNNPGALEDMQNILQITQAARKIAVKYPTATPEIQSIMNAVQQLQMKVMMAQPPSEVAAPPQ